MENRQKFFSKYFKQIKKKSPENFFEKKIWDPQMKIFQKKGAYFWRILANFCKVIRTAVKIHGKQTKMFLKVL